MTTFDEILEMSSIKSLVIDKAEKRGMKIGIELGMEIERKRNLENSQKGLIGLGQDLLGAPTAAQKKRIAAITDIRALGELQFRIHKFSTWKELLATLN